MFGAVSKKLDCRAFGVKLPNQSLGGAYRVSLVVGKSNSIVTSPSWILTKDSYKEHDLFSLDIADLVSASRLIVIVTNGLRYIWIMSHCGWWKVDL